ncbi:MAG: zeta toxin family protein [Lachnospiraceae bacterium]|nr:zeta toxin family protein [Lachnospiraceae bacterium]
MIFSITGQPVSKEMLDVIDRLEHGKYVSRNEIDKIPEVIQAYSILKKEKNKNIDTKSRKPSRDSILKEMEKVTSAETDENGKIVVDDKGETVYHGVVKREARLDIIIGLPASGKSSTLVDPISSEFKSRLIDNDKAKEKFPEYNKGWGADIVHDESRELCDKLFYDCILQKENIILPKIGNNSKTLLQAYIQQAKSEGYKVYVHFADLDRNKALGRMLKRFCEKGRFLKPELIDYFAPVENGKTHNYILDAYEALKTSGMVDGFTKWDNDVAYGEKPILLENIGCEGKFIDNARTEREGQEHGKQSRHEILGDNGSRTEIGGKDLRSGSIHNEKLGGVQKSSEREAAPVTRHSLGELPIAGNHGNEHRGSAGVGQKLDMIGVDRNKASADDHLYPLQELQHRKAEIEAKEANAPKIEKPAKTHKPVTRED